MDFRERNYYLASISVFESYDMRLSYFKLAAPSLIVRPCNDRLYALGVALGLKHPNLYLSCRKDECEDLEYELRKAERRDKYSKWVQIPCERRFVNG